MKRLYAVASATAIVLYLYGTASSAELSTENQAKLLKSVDSYAPRMSEVALKIWSAPELGYQETQDFSATPGRAKESRLQNRRGRSRHSDRVCRARGDERRSGDRHPCRDRRSARHVASRWCRNASRFQIRSPVMPADIIYSARARLPRPLPSRTGCRRPG